MRTYDAIYTSLKAISYLLVAGVVGFFLYRLLGTAWLSDDAYITYRTVDNALNGYGLRYNPGERVQTFTHPLWMLLHLPVRVLLPNMYLTGILVALGTSLAALGVAIIRQPRGQAGLIFLLMLGVASPAFLDYSTSGLENPLTHLLLAIFVGQWLDRERSRRRLFRLALIAGLLLLNRMDTILLVGPALALECWQMRSWRHLRTVLLGLAPFLLWEIFALLYYGFPFPNTAYAKLNVGFSRLEMLTQGGWYFYNALRSDPVALLGIGAGLILPLGLRWRRAYPLVGGGALYLLYIVWIGGDFMSGRFFTAPFFLALLVLLRLDRKRVSTTGLFLGIGGPALLLFYLVGRPDLPQGLIDDHGIANERAYYFSGTGLRYYDPDAELWPNFRWGETGRRLKESADSIHLSQNMGFAGYFAGPQKHLVDRLALTDPLLARIPNRYMPDWRPGHFERMLPPGYLATLKSGTNQLADPALEELYDDLKRVTQGPLWSGERLQAIFKLNFKDYGVDRAHYFLPVTQEIDLSTVAAYQAERPHRTLAVDAGVRIALEKWDGWNAIQLAVSSPERYVVVLRSRGQIVFSQEIILDEKATPVRTTLELPPQLADRAPDEILLYPLTHWRSAGLFELKMVHF
ncbi:MAG: hypothetical protein AAGN35_23900 [Bacteroidota bacterium]